MTLDSRAARSLGGNSTEHELLAPATGAAEVEDVQDEVASFLDEQGGNESVI